VDQLLIHGATLAFCVPGESYLPVLDALFEVADRFGSSRVGTRAARPTWPRPMGRLTGSPGICFVTRGPGATHAIGRGTYRIPGFHSDDPVHRQVGTEFIEREAFQEIDYRRMFGPLAKVVAQIDRAERIPEFVARAYQTATAGAWPGRAGASGGRAVRKTVAMDARRWQRVRGRPARSGKWSASRSCCGMRGGDRHLGGSGWTDAAYEDLRHSPRRKQCLSPARSGTSTSSTTRTQAIAGDVGVGVEPGPRSAHQVPATHHLHRCAPWRDDDERAMSCCGAPVPEQKLIHIHAGAEEPGRVYQADLMINATMPAARAAPATLCRASRLPHQTATHEANAALADWRSRREIQAGCSCGMCSSI